MINEINVPYSPAELIAKIDAEVTLTDDERQPCEVWTRVMGYHRPVSQYNIGKKQEQKERVNFVEPKGEDVAND